MTTAMVRDIRVYFEIEGHGPRLLLITGTNADLRRRQPYVNKLSSDFEVLRYDQRGLGQTDKPNRRYTMQDYADDAAGLLDVVGWGAVAVLGVSFGGMVAQEMARRHPGRVRKLALACSNPGGRFAYPLLQLEDADPEVRAQTMLELDLRRTAEWQQANPDLARRQLDEIKSRGQPLDPRDLSAALGARRQLEAREDHDSIGWLGQLAMPVGIFGGRHDALGSVAAQEAMSAAITGATLRLFEGAHGFLSEDPQALSAVVGFLKS